MRSRGLSSAVSQGVSSRHIEHTSHPCKQDFFFLFSSDSFNNTFWKKLDIPCESENFLAPSKGPFNRCWQMFRQCMEIDNCRRGTVGSHHGSRQWGLSTPSGWASPWGGTDRSTGSSRRTGRRSCSKT
jgi:hypothetical protein